MFLSSLIFDACYRHLQLELFPELTHNGGWCCQRQGLWSQSVNEVLVYLPEQYIQSALKLVNPEYGMSSPLQKSEIKVEFQSNSVSVLSFMGSVLFLNLCLFKQIDPSNSFWCLEHHNSFLFLVLYLQKVFPVTDTPLPGMEWWECVCDGDERIDTLLCTIGTNVTELPFHAKIRAEKEHQRYLNLSSTDQEKEIQYLIQMKQEFSKSMERTALERENEELSMEEIPERAELLRQLREEFPHISFVSK